MTAQEFIFNTPLYQKVFINEKNNFLEEIIGVEKHTPFDGYNPKQQKETTFYVIRGFCTRENPLNKTLFTYEKALNKNNIMSLLLKCGRYGDEFSLYAYWNAEEQSIMKIGQYPSVADIHIGQIKQYNKVLPKEKLKEFTRAIGLAANGVGVGSFVYLRRIFEFLIFEIAGESINNRHIDQEEFEKSRMDEKIELLKDYLPQFLVENKNIYKILSAGIHELSEDDCLAYFDVMRVSIELILDERLEALKKDAKAEKARNALSSIVASIKK